MRREYRRSASSATPRTDIADSVTHGGVRAPGGLRRLQSGWDGRTPSGGFDSRPPPPTGPRASTAHCRNRSEQGFCTGPSVDVRGCPWSVTLRVALKTGSLRATQQGCGMPKTPRGKRVVDDSTGRFTVAGKAPNGQAQPYFDRTRGVWVAPWRRPDGKVGKPLPGDIPLPHGLSMSGPCAT